MMNKAIRTLIIEDSEDDVELLLLALKRNGYEPVHQRVDSLQTLNKALDDQIWDIIFSDYAMPGFNGIEALSMIRNRGLDVPFIFISGTLCEDRAVSAMKAGAQDYIIKGNLRRLVPAVERELHEADIRRRLRRTELEQALLQEIIHAAANAGDENGAWTVALENMHKITGWGMSQVWVPNRSGTLLECGPFWYCRDSNLEPFREKSADLALRLGEDLPGRVWLTKQVAQIQGLKTNLAFRFGTLSGGIATNAVAMAMPVLAGEELVAVLEFFTCAPHENDQRSIGFISAITPPLGDIIQRKRAEQHLQHLAYHDPLTGLPNRSLFMDRFKQALIEAKRNEHLAGIIFIDLDNFKAINDKLGHNVGDLFLKEIVTRIIKCVREGDTLSRLAGDEFTLILPRMKHVYDAALVAQKILGGLKPPFHVEGRALYPSASLGIAVYPHDETNMEDLLRRADEAMYRAKESGGNDYAFYDPVTAVRTRAHLWAVKTRAKYST